LAALLATSPRKRGEVKQAARLIVQRSRSKCGTSGNGAHQ
jgi:hypothetical protein